MSVHGKALSILGVLLVAVGCAAPSPQAVQPGASGEQQSTAPKVLTIADFAEPASIFGFNGKSDGGVGAVGGLVHDLLVQEDGLRVGHASLAAELPTVEKGTWRVNPDGSMDVTWKLKPN